MPQASPVHPVSPRPVPPKPVSSEPVSSEPERLPSKELSGYGAGIIAYQYPHTGLGQLAMPLFNVALGLAPATVGAILMVGRTWDALLNPLIGTLSDNTRSRWGRRRPWILAGAILTGLAYPLIWLVPEAWDSTGKALWLLITVLLLFTAFSLYSVPYMAFGLELTPDTTERTRVQAWRTYFNLIPSFTSGWFYWICMLPVFASPIVGARWLGLGVGLLIIATGVIPALLLRERYYKVAVNTTRQRFWTSFAAAFRNRPFVVVMGIIVTLSIGVGTTDALGFYICAYHIFGGDMAAAAKLGGIAATSTIAAAFFVIPLIRKTERRLGKLRTLRLCLWVNIVTAATKWWLASPEHVWTFLSIGVFAQFGGLGFWILVNSMKADVCDYDELHSERRREGVYGAVGNLLSKLSNAAVYLFAGLLLQLIGFSAGAEGGQAPETILWLRLLYSGGPIVFLVGCLLLLDHYHLDEKEMNRIRRLLEERRSTV